MPYTPGPWEAYFGFGAGWVVRRQHERPGYTGLAPICSMAWFQFDIPGIIDNSISEANARLIAAAPDLLVALKKVCERWTFNDQQHTHTWHDWADCIPQALVLIATAEGKP